MQHFNACILAHKGIAVKEINVKTKTSLLQRSIQNNDVYYMKSIIFTQLPLIR